MSEPKNLTEAAALSGNSQSPYREEDPSRIFPGGEAEYWEAEAKHLAAERNNLQVALDEANYSLDKRRAERDRLREQRRVLRDAIENWQRLRAARTHSENVDEVCYDWCPVCVFEEAMDRTKTEEV